MDSSSPNGQDIAIIAPNKLASTTPDRLSTFREISLKIPRNDFGLPEYMYRPDLIPADLFHREPVEQASILGAAAVEINYYEGYPAFDNGASIWSQLEFEADSAFLLFKEYLTLGDTRGARRLEDLAESSKIPQGNDLRQLRDFHTYYYWSARSRAYDLFMVAAHRKLREKRVLSIQDKHFLEAETLLARVLNYFQKTDENGDLVFMNELKPRDAMDMLDKLVKIQRISVGLPAHGLSSVDENGTAKNAETEVILRQIAQQSDDPNRKSSHGGAAELEVLLNDPDTAILAQELIIRIGGVKSD